jgi:dTDP-4-amino-4,6-dideoxygalactose transaminase
MTTGKEKIFIPDLPKWSSIRKYIKQIDESKIYSNFGPLNIKFMERLEDHWNKSAKTITTSSGTSALIGAILAQNNLSKNSDKICILPSYTFVGTICAVIASGYKPFLVDIDIKTWDIDIESLKKLDFFKEISLIVPVSIYGRNVDILKWENFSSEFNIPIVIDAAASFDTLDSTYLSNLNNCILCLSFHATKVLGVGEGGCIILPKDKNLEAYLRTINFGFFQTRDSIGASINGKMSEYHAAIGLAGLDTWPEELLSQTCRQNWYRRSINLRRKHFIILLFFLQ